jgi:hypothetical protein
MTANQGADAPARPLLPRRGARRAPRSCRVPVVRCLLRKNRVADGRPPHEQGPDAGRDQACQCAEYQPPAATEVVGDHAGDGSADAVEPRKATAHNAMARPRINGEAVNCNVLFPVDWKALLTPPTTAIATSATAREGVAAAASSAAPDTSDHTTSGVPPVRRVQRRAGRRRLRLPHGGREEPYASEPPATVWLVSSPNRVSVRAGGRPSAGPTARRRWRPAQLLPGRRG